MLLVVGSLRDGELASSTPRRASSTSTRSWRSPATDELEAALEVDADVIGINNRDLEDFTVDITRTFDLLADVPAGKTVVSESGIVHREQIEELERVGVDAVLVGETVMSAADPEAGGAHAGGRARIRPHRPDRPPGVPYHRSTMATAPNSTPQRSPSWRVGCGQRAPWRSRPPTAWCATCWWRSSPRATC